MTSMNFKNSSAYAQRRIDIILRKFRHFCRAFIDDIIVFSDTLKQHLQHLLAIFEILHCIKIKLNSMKSFLGFSSVVLLWQHVDDFELSAFKNKVAAILKWKFLFTLSALKIYIEVID